MKQLYLLTLLLLLGALSAAAQNWRPFRPNGDVHAFALSRNGAATDTVLTLRLDSAGVRGADSVYFFNRIMRLVREQGREDRWRKSRNNQFGARLRYEVTTKIYWLEWAAETGQPARSVPLPVFLQEGATFASSSGLSATVVSRTVRALAGQPDSVVTLRVGAETYEVSNSYGLIAGPLPNGAGLALARLPVVAGRSYYNPLLLLDLQPGDELGYSGERLAFGGSLLCETTTLLQRIVSRQQTPDSLIYVVRYQSRIQAFGSPGCQAAAGVTFQPPATTRLAASLRTGQWQSRPSGAVAPSSDVQLLAYEWLQTAGPLAAVQMGYPIVASRRGFRYNIAAPLGTQALFRARDNPETYLGFFALDNPGTRQLLGYGVGIVSVAQAEYVELLYYRRTGSAGTTTYGSRDAFGLLLSVGSSRAAVAGVRLYPNPAATTATLELPAPAAAAAQLTVLNSAGQTLRVQQLPVGTTKATIGLAGLPVGLYLVRLEQPVRPLVLLQLQHAE